MTMIQIICCCYLASSGDMMEVADSLKALASPSSCFTLPMVGVMGSDLTGTGRVSAVTTRVSAFTCGTWFVNSAGYNIMILQEVNVQVSIAGISPCWRPWARL